MNEGRLMQVAPPAEIYEQPNSRWVADFIGEVNLIEGRRGKTAACSTTALGQLQVAGASRRQAGRQASGSRCGRRSCASRAQRPPPDGRNAVAGTVFEIGYLGDVSIYKVRLADRSLMKVALANAGGRPPFALDDLVWRHMAGATPAWC